MNFFKDFFAPKSDGGEPRSSEPPSVVANRMPGCKELTEQITAIDDRIKKITDEYLDTLEKSTKTDPDPMLSFFEESVRHNEILLKELGTKMKLIEDWLGTLPANFVATVRKRFDYDFSEYESAKETSQEDLKTLIVIHKKREAVRESVLNGYIDRIFPLHQKSTKEFGRKRADLILDDAIKQIEHSNGSFTQDERDYIKVMLTFRTGGIRAN